MKNPYLDLLAETLNPNEETYFAEIEGIDQKYIVLAPIPDSINESLTPSEILKNLRKSGWSTAGRSRERILKEIDPRFIHHDEHLKRLIDGGDGFSGGGGLRWGGLEIKGKNALLRVMGSLEYDKPQEIYQQVIHFANFDKIANAKGLTWPQKAQMLMKDRLKIHCDCKAFQYFHAHAATKKGFSLYPELRPSDKTNPSKRGGICKHLNLVLKWLPTQGSSIAGEMKEYFERGKK